MLGLAQARKSEFPAVGEAPSRGAGDRGAERPYAREIALADEYLGDLTQFACGILTERSRLLHVPCAREEDVARRDIVAEEVLRRETEVFLMQRKFEEVLSVGAKALDVAVKSGEI